LNKNVENIFLTCSLFYIILSQNYRTVISVSFYSEILNERDGEEEGRYICILDAAFHICRDWLVVIFDLFDSGYFSRPVFLRTAQSYYYADPGGRNIATRIQKSVRGTFAPNNLLSFSLLPPSLLLCGRKISTRIPA